MAGINLDDRGVVVACTQCGQNNRLAYERLSGAVRCGTCKTTLAAPGLPIEVKSSADFDRLIARSPLPVVVDYWAPWCGPCRMVAPELEKVAARQAGRFVVVKVNTDALGELGERFGIRSIPTLAVFAGGREVARSSGTRPANEIEAFVEQATRPSQHVMKRSLRRLLVCTVIIPIFTVTVPGAGLQVGTSDPGSATAIEQALIEQACSTTRTAGAPDTDAYHECLNAQLLSLRNDLGRDLGRLSSAERRTLDSVCSDIRAAGGREAYLECLSARLTSLRNRRKSATPAPSPGTALTPPPVSAPDSPAPPVRQASSRSSGLWIGATLLTLFAAVGGVLFAMRARHAPRRCRGCGEVPESGDLCQKCRHEAAEAVRGAALARADQQRAQAAEAQAEEAQAEEAQAEEERQQEEHGGEHQVQKAFQEEGVAHLRQQEEALQPEEDTREREDAREREEVFDPYAVLGVPRNATREDIDAAYQEGKLKYDPDHVAHLSAEVQEHFKAKAQQVDRAHQKLTE